MVVRALEQNVLPVRFWGRVQKGNNFNRSEEAELEKVKFLVGEASVKRAVCGVVPTSVVELLSKGELHAAESGQEILW